MADLLDSPEGLERLELPQLQQLVSSLQQQRRQRSAKVEILEDRVQATNHELAQRKTEAALCRKNFYSLKNDQRPREEVDDAAEALAQRGQLVRTYVEKYLHQQLQEAGRLLRDGYGFVERAPQAMMVTSGAAGSFRETVLVTYVEPHLEQQQHLSYRIAEVTTVKELKLDACTYWSLNPEEFVLRVLNNSLAPDSARVCRCFREKEESQLILVYKTPKSETILASEVADIQPRYGRKRPKKPNVEKSQRPGRSRKALAEQMQRLPGLFKFMTQRDRNVKRHLQRMKLSSLCVYVAWAVLTILTIGLLRPPGVGYECAEGISETLVSGLHATPFFSIRSEEGIWQWLQSTVPAELLSEDSMLREYNYLVGELEVLAQRVAAPVPCQGNISCVDLAFHDATAEKTQLADMERYWKSRVGQAGRSWSSRPWEHQTARDTSGAYPRANAFRRGDASGQRVEYQLQYMPLSDVRTAFMEDMQFLQSVGWLSQMRALHLSFLAYNANHQTWIWNRYTFELSAFGTVHPLQYQEPFRPRLLEFGQDAELCVSDVIRSCLLLLVILQVYRDFRYEQRETGAGWPHFFTVQALADLTIAVLFFTALGLRMSYYTGETSTSYANSHPEAGGDAERFGVQVTLEAVLLAVCLFRVVYFMRVNRQVFVLWRSVSRSVGIAARLLPLLLLFLLGVLVMGLAFGARTHECNRSVTAAASCGLLVLAGDARPAALAPGESGRLIYVIFLFCVGRLLLTNSWLAILMQEYHTARVEAGDKSTYRWQEYDWVRWCLAWPLDRLYLKLRPSIQPVKRFED